MRIPETAPDHRIFSRLSDGDRALMMRSINPLASGKYLHWDELRHRQPPNGLSRDGWWAALVLGRSGLMQQLPLLLDKKAQPFVFATPSPVMIDLHHIDRDAAGQIRTTSSEPIHEAPAQYLFSSLIEEAITSSQLEGAATTRQVAAAMLREGRKPSDLSETMIFNNFRAMDHLLSLKQQAISAELILELHRMLTENTLENQADAGRLRETDDIQVLDRRDNTTMHVPPPSRELPERLDRLCAFANADETSLPFVHPVLRAILLHFMIGYDHPFVDGNGRTARALFYWAMARSGYWLMEYTSISHILRRSQRSYMRAYLMTETGQNDTTYFLLHQLSTIRRAIAALHVYLARKTGEQRETEQLLAKSPKLRTMFNHRQIVLLTHALRNAGESYRVDAHQRTHNVVYQTARSDLLSLHALGLLDLSKKGNAYVYYAPENLRDRLSILAK